MNDLIKQIEEVLALADKATPGPFHAETVTTSCGLCHKIGPLPPKREGGKERWICIYDDYPGADGGTPNLVGLAAFIAAAPHMADLLRQAATMVRDAERLDWLERKLFNKHWDGCIGRPAYWSMAGPYRHTLQKMRGNDLREAIDAAMQQERSSDE